MSEGGHGFGDIALRQKYVTPAQVDECMAVWHERRSGGEMIAPGRVFLERGYLTERQVEVVVLAQQYHRAREEDRRLGRMAINNKLLTVEQVKWALGVQKEYMQRRRHILRLGAICRKQGLLTEQQVEALVRARARKMSSSDVQMIPGRRDTGRRQAIAAPPSVQHDGLPTAEELLANLPPITLSPLKEPETPSLDLDRAIQQLAGVDLDAQVDALVQFLEPR